MGGLCLFEVDWGSVGAAAVGLGSCLFAGFEQDFGFGLLGCVLGFGTVDFGGWLNLDFVDLDFVHLDLVNVCFVNYACLNYGVQDFAERGCCSLDYVNCYACSA